MWKLFNPVETITTLGKGVASGLDALNEYDELYRNENVSSPSLFDSVPAVAKNVGQAMWSDLTGQKYEKPVKELYSAVETPEGGDYGAVGGYFLNSPSTPLFYDVKPDKLTISDKNLDPKEAITTLRHETDHKDNPKTTTPYVESKLGTPQASAGYYSQPTEISARLAELEAMNDIIGVYKSSKYPARGDRIDEWRKKANSVVKEIQPYMDQYKKDYYYDKRIPIYSSFANYDTPEAEEKRQLIYQDQLRRLAERRGFVDSN